MRRADLPRMNAKNAGTQPNTKDRLIWRYQLTRSVNCISRDPLLLDSRVLTSPFDATVVGMPGLLNTLNASILSRIRTASPIRTSLNSEASWPNSHTPGRNGFRHG